MNGAILKQTLPFGENKLEIWVRLDGEIREKVRPKTTKEHVADWDFPKNPISDETRLILLGMCGVY